MGITICIVTLQALSGASVVIDPPVLTWDELSLPPSGVIRHPEGVGGPSLHSRRFSFDLDSSDPMTPVYSDRGGEERSPAFSMNRGDVERIEIVVTATRGMHAWTAALPLIANGRRQTLTIASEDGEPFITVGENGIRMLVWLDDTQRWTSPSL